MLLTKLKRLDDLRADFCAISTKLALVEARQWRILFPPLLAEQPERLPRDLKWVYALASARSLLDQAILEINEALDREARANAAHREP